MGRIGRTGKSSFTSILEDFRDLPWHLEVFIIFIFASSISFLIWAGYGFFGHEQQVATVQELYWKRIIHIETYMTIHESDTTWSPPHDAYNVNQWTETRLVQHTSFNSKGRPETEYRLETETHYSYDVNRWRHFRDVVSEAFNDSPEWAEFTLMIGPLGQMNRESGRTEIYEVHVTTFEGPKILTLSQSEWEGFSVDEKVIAEVNGFGWIQKLTQVESE